MKKTKKKDIVVAPDVDVNGDGYYDDVQPKEEEGDGRDTLDKEVVKRVGIIIGITLAILVGLAFAIAATMR